MTKRFATPPEWPTPPADWHPPKGWRPDPEWGPAPAGWQFWQSDRRGSWIERHKLLTALLAVPLALLLGLFWGTGLTVGGQPNSSGPQFVDDAGRQSSKPAPEVSAKQATAADVQAAKALAAQTEAHKEAAEKAAASKKAAEVEAAKAEAAATKAAKVKAAKIKAAKAKAAKIKVAKIKAAKIKAAKERAARDRAAQAAAEAAQAQQDSSCTSGYSPCLPPASDYDCEGGSGNGPEYTGTVRVTGDDPYDLDRDGDGVGCDS